MSRREQSYWFFGAILLGIVVGHAVGLFSVVFESFFLYVVVVIVLVAVVWMWHDTRMRIITVAALLFVLGITCVMIAVPAHGELPSSRVTGVIRDFPRVSEKAQIFTIRDDVSGASVDVIAALYPRYQYGDWLHIICASTEGLACLYPEVHVLGQGMGYPMMERIARLRSAVATQINTMFPEPYAGLAQALTLGDRSAITANVRLLFTKTGTNHLVAISGMHMVILSKVLTLLLVLLPLTRRKQFWIAASTLMCFTFFIGTPASAVRGVGFAILLLVAETLGRQRNMTSALLATATVMLVARPLWLFDLGFQLSFLATIGIVYGVPILMYAWEWVRLRYTRLDTVITRLPQWSVRPLATIGALVLVSITATIITTPLIVATFERTTLLGLPANVLLVPLLPFVFGSVLASVVVGTIFPFAHMVLAAIPTALMALMLGVMRVLASLPGHTITLSSVSFGVLVFTYSILFSAIFFAWQTIPFSNRSFALTAQSSSDS